ncbi:unknown [Clostridium sp. CAG:75]|nr:unknown [Clostridium sp. CAG:75]
MQTRKTIIAAALVWMAGLLGIILFQDVFAGSLLGAVLGILMVIVTLAATYFMVDGMLMLKQQSEEQQDLLQRAYQDKLLELMS